MKIRISLSKTEPSLEHLFSFIEAGLPNAKAKLNSRKFDEVRQQIDELVSHKQDFDALFDKQLQSITTELAKYNDRGKEEDEKEESGEERQEDSAGEGSEEDK